ncbi:MAG: AI-2E family transporter [Flavisolibacter sp.]|nr:AI-2E family transporter [Flavisolibacter sp.]MBD0366869.1 AI-2E family transporter [Flavisolibacter sp.]
MTSTNPNNTINTNLLRQIFFILIILFLGIVILGELWFLLSAFLGSVTFYVLMRERMFYLTEKRGWKRSTAAWVLMLLSFFVILVPIGLLANILYAQVSYVVTHSTELLSSLKKLVVDVNQKIGYEILKPENINQLGPYLAQLLPKILGTTLSTITLIGALYFVLYFMLVNGRSMEEALYEYIPLKDSNVDLLGKQVKIMVISNTVGIPLIALIQGVVGLVGYLIIGISQPFLWFVATCLAAMLPIVGAALVYVPLAISLFVQGEIGRGIAMTIWGFVFIGLSDNLFRFMINRKLGNIHPLITVFGVLVGIKLFGFIGLVFGPLLISMFILLLRIYGNEFLLKRREMHRVK